MQIGPKRNRRKYEDLAAQVPVPKGLCYRLTQIYYTKIQIYSAKCWQFGAAIYNAAVPHAAAAAAAMTVIE